MIIDGIYSLRGFRNENFRQTVFEWEDDLVDILQPSRGIIRLNNPEEKVLGKVNMKLAHRLPLKNQKGNVNLAFCMNLYETDYFKMVK